jgi:hypothetical protein
VAVAACVAALAPPASAGWLAPLPLSAPDRPAQNPALALGADGRLAAAWARSDGAQNRIEVAMRDPGGTLEPAQIVSEAGVSASSAQVGLDAEGNALLMWVRGQSVQWATRAADAGAFGDLHTVGLPADERASTFQLAVAPGGDAAVVFLTLEGMPTANHYRLRVMTRVPGGDFQLSPVLDEATEGGPGDVYSFTPLDMDADALGGFYATWTRRHAGAPSTSETAVKVAVRAAGAASFGVENVAAGLEDPGDLLRDTRVGAASSGVDAAGALSVGYVLVHPDSAPSQSAVRLRSRPAGGPFDPGVEPVTTFEPNGPVELDAALNPAGTALLVWRRGTGSDEFIEACARLAGGPCGATQPLASGSVFDPVAAIGVGGETAVAWRRGLGTAEASFAPAGGTLGPAHDLGSGSQVLVPHNGIGVDALGHAVLTVDHFEAGMRHVEAAVNDPVPPQILTLIASPRGQPGEPFYVGGGVSDVWGPVTTAWDFGDGSSAPGLLTSHVYAAPGMFSAALTATDAGGNTATRSASVAVVDERAPGVLSFGMTHRAFAIRAASKAQAGGRRRPPRGTVFRFSLTEAASARIEIQRARAGRRDRGRCRKPSARLRTRRRCTRWARVGTLVRQAPAGVTRVPFSGRLGRRALRLGSHRAVLVATDASGNRSRAARVRFRVVRR